MWYKEADENIREVTAKLVWLSIGNTYAVSGTFSHTPSSDSESDPGNMLNFAIENIPTNACSLT
jgi:hypothetical protein